MVTNDIYKQKTLDSAINTISEKMESIFNDTDINKNKNRRRWIWELIQNASDCFENKPVDIRVDSTDSKVVFKHSGKCFNKENLIDLYTQISAKRTNEEKTGKFGTGFISTHLLSTKVKIRGIYQSSDNKFRKLDLLLDRSATNDNDLRNSISAALDNIDNLDNSEIIDNYYKYSTAFEYNYDASEIRISKEEFQRACKEAYKDWEKTIPFVLTFSDKIGTVQFNNIIVKKELIKEGTSYKRIEIRYYDQNMVLFRSIPILIKYEDSTSIACLLSTDKNSIHNFEDMSTYPKLFCVFPLIGTENFPFPVIINDSNFYVTKERDNILINQNINVNILNKALTLYNKLLKIIEKNNIGKSYNICKIEDSNINDNELAKYKDQVQTSYTEASIVKAVTPDDKENFCSINNIIIPYYEHNINDFWNLVHKTVNCSLPNLCELIKWKEVLPKSKEKNIFTVTRLIENIQGREINSNTPSILNELYRLCWNPEKNKFPDNMIFLNQNNEYKKIDFFTQLYFDDTDDELKEILRRLGGNAEESLLNKELARYEIFNSKNNKDIADDICRKIREQLSKENSNSNYVRSIETQHTFNKLIIWFMKYPEESKIIFSDIYEKQHLLSKPEDTIKKLELATQVENAMVNNNINIDQFSSILSNIGNLCTLLNNEDALSDDARQLLKHISSQGAYSAQKVQEMIERSINNVYYELKKNPRYEISESLEKWKEEHASKTVFFAKKDHKDIRIVIRPRDYNKIIFYEDAEFDAVDDYEYELWTDDGKTVKQITLKDLLKTTGITCFPLKNLYK